MNFVAAVGPVLWCATDLHAGRSVAHRNVWFRKLNQNGVTFLLNLEKEHSYRWQGLFLQNCMRAWAPSPEKRSAQTSLWYNSKHSKFRQDLWPPTFILAPLGLQCPPLTRTAASEREREHIYTASNAWSGICRERECGCALCPTRIAVAVVHA